MTVRSDLVDQLFLPNSLPSANVSKECGRSTFSSDGSIHDCSATAIRQGHDAPHIRVVGLTSAEDTPKSAKELLGTHNETPAVYIASPSWGTNAILQQTKEIQTPQYYSLDASSSIQAAPGQTPPGRRYGHGLSRHRKALAKKCIYPHFQLSVFE